MMRAAVQGTTSLLASALAESKRGSGDGALQSVVFMSTVSAIFSPSKPAGHVFTEADWNDAAEEEVRRLGKTTPGYVIYQASKTAAERAFWRFGKETGSGFGMSALCPAYVSPCHRKLAISTSDNIKPCFWTAALPTRAHLEPQHACQGYP
jgi:nucleoside-diphosphate-sugar epimerase